MLDVFNILGKCAYAGREELVLDFDIFQTKKEIMKLEELLCSARDSDYKEQLKNRITCLRSRVNE